MATPDERRERWQRSADHKTAHGLKMETDPLFLGWIEEWIAGEVSIQEVQRRYGELLQSRDKNSLKSYDVATTAVLKELREEIPELGDFAPRHAKDRSQTTHVVNAAWGIDE